MLLRQLPSSAVVSQQNAGTQPRAGMLFLSRSNPTQHQPLTLTASARQRSQLARDPRRQTGHRAKKLAKMAANAQQSHYELYRGTSYARSLAAYRTARSCACTNNVLYSIGLALADTLDDLISSRRIEPQLAMRIMQNFDEMIAKVLGEKVKARLTFKVRATAYLRP